jgi:hypothetical protein
VEKRSSKKEQGGGVVKNNVFLLKFEEALPIDFFPLQLAGLCNFPVPQGP